MTQEKQLTVLPLAKRAVARFQSKTLKTTNTVRSFGRLALALALVCLGVLSVTQLSFAQTTLWRVGKEDNSKAEFPADPKVAPPATYAIPGDWNTRASFPEWSGASNGDWDSNRNFDTTISYSLAGVPANGAEFQFKTLNASQFVPQLAVFSNGKLAGIINMMGTRYFGTPNPGEVIPFGDLFRVYIPKEFLVAGANTLRIKKLEHPFSSASGSVTGGANFPYLSFEYDFFKLVSLSSPASEPIHGRYINLSAESQTSSTAGSFAISDAEVGNRPQALKWLGVAYSGNMERAVFWRDVAAQQPRRLEYLQMLRDMNMQVLMDFYSRTRDPQQTANTAEWTVDANGVLLGGPHAQTSPTFSINTAISSNITNSRTSRQCSSAMSRFRHKKPSPTF